MDDFILFFYIDLRTEKIKLEGQIK